MKTVSIVCISLCVCAGLSAQDLQLLHTIPFEQPSAVSIDQSGSLYVADAMGNLFQYTPEGAYTVEYSPERPAKITDLEAWQGLRIFLFYRDIQEYTFLNRFLIAQGTYAFNPASVGFVESAAPSADNNIWLFDQSDFSLKKYNVQLKEVVLNTRIDLLLDPDNYRIGGIREYQNKVYMSDYHQGIFVFDNLGNYLRQIPASGVEFFSFYGQQLHFLQKNQLIGLDLYSGEREPVALPADVPWRHALKYRDRLYLVSGSEIRIYQ